MAEQNPEAPQRVLGSRIVSVPEPFSHGDIAQWLKKSALCADANGWHTEDKEEDSPYVSEGTPMGV